MAGTNTPMSVDPDSTQHEILVKKLEAAQRNMPPSNEAELEQKLAESVIFRLNNEFGILNCEDGDSLLYIGPPPQTLAESRTWDQSYIQYHFSFPHRVHSRKFLCLGSQKFQDLFGPRSVRTERRLRKEGVLSRVSTEGIRFFVDLRPPTEDDEAVVLLTTLTCTKGVLTWHMAQKIYDLSSLLVAGQDDSSTISAGLPLTSAPLNDKNISDKSMLHRPRSSSGNFHQPLGTDNVDTLGARLAEDLTDLELQGKDTEQRNENGSLQDLSTTSLRAPVSNPTSSDLSKTSTQTSAATVPTQLEEPAFILLEYSPLRHRSAIERLVQAIENGDPKLDSAPKVWTFFAVAKYFDCASHERISGWIIKWLLSYPNSNFIQCNPEVALRIGLATQSESVTKSAFSILVGEKSLLNVFGESKPSVLTPVERSVHGRRLELLDDDERNRIDHAAASLVRHIRQRFDDLVGEEMTWLRQSSQFEKVTSLVPYNQEEADVFKALIQRIKDFVRGRINWVLCRTYDDDFSEFEQQLKRVRAFYPDTPDTFRETYNKLNERERIFTRFFWVALTRESFADGKINLWTERVSKLGLPHAGSTYLSQKMLDRSMPSGQRMCQVVSRKELAALITEFNGIGRVHGAIKTRNATRPSLNTVPTPETEALSPTKHEFHVRQEQSADTIPHQVSSGRYDDNPGSVITAADWSLPADDFDQKGPQMDQQLSDYFSTDPVYSQPAFVMLGELLSDLSNVLHRRCQEILYPAHLFHGDNSLPTNLIDNLMCLNDDEWKYLPLWAGGNDDGTGGVFDEVDVPNLEAGGFKGGKRGIGSVSDNGATSSVSGSSFDDVGSDAISTVGKASKVATDGTQTVKSLSDVGSEDEDFMRQTEIWDEIRNMKVDGAQPISHRNGTGLGKSKARDEERDDDFFDAMDEQDADDVDTMIGVNSSSDGNDGIDDNEERDNMSDVIRDDDSEDDMEIINAEHL